MLTALNPEKIVQRRSLSPPLLAVCLSILLPVRATAQSVSLEAYRTGAAAVDRAARALAAQGVAPPELNALTVWMTGINLQRFQSPSPDPPFDTLRSEERLAFRPGEDRVGIEFRAWWPSFVRHVTQVAGPAGGSVEDFNMGSTRFEPGLTTDRLASLRHRIPHLVVRDALDGRASIRHLGSTVFDGREAEVVSYLQPDGETGALYLSEDPNRPVLAHELLASDLRRGDAPRVTLYADYATFDGVLLPATVTVLIGGIEEIRLRLDSASAAVPVAAEALALLDRVEPEGAETDGRPANPAGPMSPARVDTVGPGVYLVAPPQAPNYRVLFVEADDGLVAVEAPQSVEATAAAIRAIRDALGPRPIRYAAITHHHADHSGGIAAFAQEDATLLTTPGNVDFVRDLVGAHRSLEGHTLPAADPMIEAVRDSVRIPTDAGPLFLVDVGPHDHANEHLVALMPDVGLVFQGDLVQFPHDGSVEAARPQTFALVELIERLPWSVRRIAGVHGRVGTPDDLAAAVQAAGEADDERYGAGAQFVAYVECSHPRLEQLEARCGGIQVPADHMARTGASIDLYFVVVPGDGPDVAPDPVFFLSGGPGQASSFLAAWMGSTRHGALARRDLVFLDQRGTGRSTPLDCPSGSEIGSAFGRLHPRSDVLRECLVMHQESLDPRLFTTHQSAYDVEALRSALGYDRINLDGGSYGTRLALEYMRRFEPRVRSALLTGVMPPDFKAPLWYARGAQEGLEHIFRDCAAESACADAFPELPTRWQRVVARLKEAPVRVRVRASPDAPEETVTFTANDLAYTVRSALYGPAALNLPALIHRAAETGDVSGFAELYALRAASLRPTIARGLHLSVLCTEDVHRIAEDEIGPAVQGTYLEDYAVREYQRACRTWTVGTVPPDFFTPVRAETPVLVVSGRRDPTTPPSTGESVVRHLPNALHIVHRWGGHGFPGILDERCQPTIEDAFLERGSIDGVDLSCLQRARPLPFRLEAEDAGGSR